MLFNEDELELRALTWKGARETLSVKTGYSMREHDFIYGKTTTAARKH